MTNLIRSTALAGVAAGAVVIGWGGSTLLVEHQLTAAAAKADQLALEAPCVLAAVDTLACRQPGYVTIQSREPSTTVVTRVEVSLAEQR